MAIHSPNFYHIPCGMCRFPIILNAMPCSPRFTSLCDKKQDDLILFDSDTIHVSRFKSSVAGCVILWLKKGGSNLCIYIYGTSIIY